MKLEFLIMEEVMKKVRRSGGRMVSGRSIVFLNMEYSEDKV